MRMNCVLDGVALRASSLKSRSLYPSQSENIQESFTISTHRITNIGTAMMSKMTAKIARVCFRIHQVIPTITRRTGPAICNQRPPNTIAKTQVPATRHVHVPYPGRRLMGGGTPLGRSAFSSISAPLLVLPCSPYACFHERSDAINGSCDETRHRTIAHPCRVPRVASYVCRKRNGEARCGSLRRRASTTQASRERKSSGSC